MGAFENTTNLAISDYSKDKILLFPNPANNAVYMDIDQFEMIRFYSSTGQLVLESTENKIDISNLEKGVYIVKVDIGESQEFFRLIKE